MGFCFFRKESNKDICFIWRVRYMITLIKLVNPISISSTKGNQPN